MAKWMEGQPSLQKTLSNTTSTVITTESSCKQPASPLKTESSHLHSPQFTAPPKHAIKASQFLSFYSTLGPRFLAGGDYNAKHTRWGSRLTSPKGRELFSAMQTANLDHVSTGEPTYWPSDRRKVPDLVDFAVVRRIPVHTITASSSPDLSSDHSPVTIVLHSRFAPNQVHQPSALSGRTGQCSEPSFKHLSPCRYH